VVEEEAKTKAMFQKPLYFTYGR